MSQVDKVIKIKCGGEAYLDINELHWLQGKLKSITDKKFHILKESLKLDGIVFGFHAWKDSKGKVWTLDGNHRILALKALREEGWTVPKIPVNFVKAQNKKEAAKSILISNSRYAKMNEDSISDFMIDYELDVSDLTLCDLPDIRQDYFSRDNDLTNKPGILESDASYIRNEEKTLEQIPTSNTNENVSVGDIKEEKMDVVGRRYVIIIDCKDQEHKDTLKEQLHNLVTESGAKFF